MKATRKAGGPRKAIISTIIFAISLSIAVLLFASAAIAGIRWTANGVEVTTGTGNIIPQVVPNDAGGSIVAWYGPGTLMVQRLDPNGNAMWTAGGVQVCNDAGLSTVFGIAPDASHGAYLTWIDRVAGPYDHLYAQHVDPNGVLLTRHPASPECPSARQPGAGRSACRPTCPSPRASPAKP